MSDVPFHATRMGQVFYERTLPELVRQVTRLADAVVSSSRRAPMERSSPLYFL